MTTPTISGAIPTLSADDLAARTIHRRALEAVIWGIPAVNFNLMYHSFVRDAKGGIALREDVGAARHRESVATPR